MHGYDIELAETHPRLQWGSEEVSTRICDSQTPGEDTTRSARETDEGEGLRLECDCQMAARGKIAANAAQDGMTYTLAYRQGILKHNVNPTCRRCEDAPETLGHILAACKTTHFGLIKLCHDKELYCLASDIMRALGLKVPSRLRTKEGGEAPGVYGTRIMVDQLVCTARPCNHR